MITLKNFAHMSVDGFSIMVVEFGEIEFELPCYKIAQISEFTKLYVHGWTFDHENCCLRVYVNRGE